LSDDGGKGTGLGSENKKGDFAQKRISNPNRKPNNKRGYQCSVHLRKKKSRKSLTFREAQKGRNLHCVDFCEGKTISPQKETLAATSARGALKGGANCFGAFRLPMSLKKRQPDSSDRRKGLLGKKRSAGSGR